MIDHVSIPVADLQRSKRFYTAALKPLGYSLIMEYPGAAGLGIGGKPDLWLHQGDPGTSSLHVAIQAPDVEAIEAFYKAALAAGGKDNGRPGPRPQYHARYWGAFVLDADGHNIEAALHNGPTSGKTD